MPERRTIQVLDVSADKEDEAVRVLARAFVANPLHVAVFGRDPLTANRTFFRLAMQTFVGEKRIAVDDGTVVGFVHWVPSPRCQLSSVRKLGIAAAMVRGFGVQSTIRVAKWLSVWSKHDPHEPHIHLGPIGVVPEVRGHGIGRLLMEPFCSALDATGAIGYLETDRPENVDFYSKFGFEVAERALVHGVVNHFMRRPSRR